MLNYINNAEADTIQWLKNKLDYNIVTNKIIKKFYCGENINSGQACTIGSDGRVYVFDITNSEVFKSYIGVCETGATIHNVAIIVTHGLVTTPTRSYIPGAAYYISALGYLSSSADSRFVTQIAVGIDNNRVLLIGGGGGSSTGESSNSYFPSGWG